MSFEPDYLNANVSYIGGRGQPTPQLMIFWQKFMKALKDAIDGLSDAVTRLTAAEGEIDALGTPQYLTLLNTTSLTNERRLAAGSGLSGTDAGAGSTYTLALTDTGVSAGSYGTATKVARITVDAKGRVTNVSEVTISASGGGAFAPLTTGSEPITLVSDGAGQCIMVPI